MARTDGKFRGKRPRVGSSFGGAQWGPEPPSIEAPRTPRPTYGKTAAQLDREIAEALAKGDHATKKRSVPRGRYWIAPASDPKDRYAAGYEGNQFSSRKEAEAAIRSLRRLGGEFNVAWVVNKDALVATSHATVKTNLPHDLYAAYDWTKAAGELDQLKRLTGKALDKYCRESVANAREHDVTDVSAADLKELAIWMRAQG